MVAIGISSNLLCRKIQSASFEKQVTPFSIDDILANSKPGVGDEMVENDSFKLPPFLHKLSPLSSFWNQDMQLKWMANLHRLCMLNAYQQPFWCSPLDPLPLSMRCRLYNTNTSHPYCDLHSLEKLFKTSAIAVRSKEELRKRKRNNKFKSTVPKINPPPKLLKICQKSKTETPGRRSRNNSSCLESDDGHIEDRPKSNETSQSDSPLSALEKLTCATFKGMERSKNFRIFKLGFNT